MAIRLSTRLGRCALAAALAMAGGLLLAIGSPAQAAPIGPAPAVSSDVETGITQVRHAWDGHRHRGWGHGRGHYGWGHHRHHRHGWGHRHRHHGHYHGHRRFGGF